MLAKKSLLGRSHLIGTYGDIRIMLPRFEIVANPVIKLAEVRQRRFLLFEEGVLLIWEEVCVGSGNTDE